MKKITRIVFSLFLFSAICAQATAQERSRTDNLDMRPLLFNNFFKAEIFKTDGSVVPASVNYNTNTQSIIFLTEDTYMELTGLEEIKEIKIGDDVFVPIAGKVYQTTPDANLYVSYSNKVGVNEVTTTKMGSGTRDSRITSNSVTDVYVTQNYISPNELVYVKNFWLMKNENLIEITNFKKLGKALGVDKNEIKKYVSNQKLDLNSFSDVKKLLESFTKN